MIQIMPILIPAIVEPEGSILLFLLVLAGTLAGTLLGQVTYLFLVKLFAKRIT